MEDHAKRILKVLIYIEDNIHDKVSVEELARVAALSLFHFQRVFRFIVGESVHKYMRRLRMERSMMKLGSSEERITDIGLDAGFETPSAFTKAFRQCVGQSPRSYRLLLKELTMAEKKLSDLAMIQPDEIKNVSEIPILFIRRTGDYETTGKEAWDVMKAFMKENSLDETKLRYFHIAHDDPKITDVDKLRYDACISDPNVSVKGEAARKTLPGGKYAIFTVPANIPDKEFEIVFTETFDRILFRWLPNSKERCNEQQPWHVEFIDGTIAKIYVPLV